jgi:hypothetical protein
MFPVLGAADGEVAAFMRMPVAEVAEVCHSRTPVFIY